MTLQTRVTSYRRAADAAGPAELDLYSIVHYADREYYLELNRALQRYDRVYFECITSDSNVSENASSKLRSLKLPVGPSAKAAAEARGLGLVPQMSAWDSSLPNGFLADLTTSELAVIARQSPAAEAVPADVTMSGLSRLAFSAFRLACFLLPCPEVAVLFADSLRPAAGAVVPRSFPFFLFALVRGDLRAGRKLLFAQVVEATTRERAVLQVSDVAVRARNLRVLEAVGNGGGDCVAVVYGAWHSGHLASMCETDLGLRYRGGGWRNAICAEKAADGRAWTRLWALAHGDVAPAGQLPVAQLSAIFAVVIGAEVFSALDYISAFATSVPTILEDVAAASNEAAALSVLLYSLRHYALYIFLRRWLLYGGAITL